MGSAFRSLALIALIAACAPRAVPVASSPQDGSAPFADMTFAGCMFQRVAEGPADGREPGRAARLDIVSGDMRLLPPEAARTSLTVASSTLSLFPAEDATRRAAEGDRFFARFAEAVRAYEAAQPQPLPVDARLARMRMEMHADLAAGRAHEFAYRAPARAPGAPGGPASQVEPGAAAFGALLDEMIAAPSGAQAVAVYDGPKVEADRLLAARWLVGGERRLTASGDKGAAKALLARMREAAAAGCPEAAL